jgi:hypothetical protein
MFNSTSIIESNTEYTLITEINYDVICLELYFIPNTSQLSRKNGPAVKWNVDKTRKPEYWLNGKHYRDITSDNEWLIFQIIV